ncbi:MAG TPA: TRAP transporter substrate-binding protein DctP [Burkholderiaceae bacterium]|nr:TRAP transporter substrate-binding protein DctP [Burkholderiaceae bacterium]
MKIHRSSTMPSSRGRRRLLAAAVAAPTLLGSGRSFGKTTLKLSHQAPGGTLDQGDIRDRMALRFAQDAGKRSGGEIEVQVYPGSSLMKPNAQFAALRKGALDLSLFPISSAGGEFPELNIGLMPGIVSSYDEAYAWKGGPIGAELTRTLESKGVVVVSWLWLAGGAASRTKPVIVPSDAQGLKVRGGSREMDLVLKAAGATPLSLPSTELYQAMQTGACDACITSSTSMASFRLVESARHLTLGPRSYWFIFGPLLMSKAIFEALPKPQRDVVMAVGAEIEAFGRQGAIDADRQVAAAFKAAGASVHDLDAAAIEKWRTLARTTAWKDYADKSADCAKLLELATKALP